MVLNAGEWQGRQIVSADWIKQSTTPQINGEGIFFYGYQWWLGRSLVRRREIDWIAGVGLGGQRVYIAPEKRLVVVVNAGLYDKPLQATVGGIALRQVFAAMVD